MKIKKAVIQNMMDRAITINKNDPQECRDFRIMTSPEHPDTLLLRWLTIDLSDLDRPIQKYQYECFELDGTTRGCSLLYTDQEEANIFFEGLTTLYQQQYAIDHKL